MGTPYTPAYDQFRNDLAAFLHDKCEVNPRIIGKNEYPDGSPLEHIRKVMRTCSGLIIVAYERKFVQTGTEKRGSAEEQKIRNRVYTTPWNHVESAIAYSLELPIFILCQNGLQKEGLIDVKLDWYVKELDIKPGIFLDSDVAEHLRAWATRRVIPRSKKRSAFVNLMGRVKLGEMTPAEFWEFLLFAMGIFVAGAIFGATAASNAMHSVLEFLHKLHSWHF
jgi:hypothetical protein